MYARSCNWSRVMSPHSGLMTQSPAYLVFVPMYSPHLYQRQPLIVASVRSINGQLHPMTTNNVGRMYVNPFGRPYVVCFHPTHYVITCASMRTGLVIAGRLPSLNVLTGLTDAEVMIETRFNDQTGLKQRNRIGSGSYPRPVVVTERGRISHIIKPHSHDTLNTTRLQECLRIVRYPAVHTRSASSSEDRRP